MSVNPTNNVINVFSTQHSLDLDAIVAVYEGRIQLSKVNQMSFDIRKIGAYSKQMPLTIAILHYKSDEQLGYWLINPESFVLSKFKPTWKLKIVFFEVAESNVCL